jgi:two-component system, NtrC family, response regulator HydG
LAEENRPLGLARVLVVASDLRLRLYLGELLLAHFGAVNFTQSGAEGLSHLQNNSYDVVICDYFLQDMDGINFRESMTQMNDSTHFILLTAHSSDPRIQKQLAKDQFFVQQKPPHPDEFIFLIRSRCQKKKAA